MKQIDKIIDRLRATNKENQQDTRDEEQISDTDYANIISIKRTDKNDTAETRENETQQQLTVPAQPQHALTTT